MMAIAVRKKMKRRRNQKRRTRMLHSSTSKLHHHQNLALHSLAHSQSPLSKLKSKTPPRSSRSLHFRYRRPLSKKPKLKVMKN